MPASGPAIALARPDALVHGGDPSPGAVRCARANARRSGVRNARFHRGPPAVRADAVIAAWPWSPTALGVLRPGGRLLVHLSNDQDRDRAAAELVGLGFDLPASGADNGAFLVATAPWPA